MAAFPFEPPQADPGRPDARTGKVRAGDVGAEMRIAREGIERIAHGALVCPACDLPVVIEGRLAAERRLHCGFCDHEARAREFVAPDVFDTVANEIYLIARVA